MSLKVYIDKYNVRTENPSRFMYSIKADLFVNLHLSGDDNDVVGNIRLDLGCTTHPPDLETYLKVVSHLFCPEVQQALLHDIGSSNVVIVRDEFEELGMEDYHEYDFYPDDEPTQADEIECEWGHKECVGFCDNKHEEEE